METVKRPSTGCRKTGVRATTVQVVKGCTLGMLKWSLVLYLAFAAYPVSPDRNTPISEAEAGVVSSLSGKITDVGGKPVAAARVFLYDSRDVRRPPDFLSAPAGPDGHYRLELPSGAYRAVARLKMIGGYGPLLPGDKHSGEPVEIEIDPGASVALDFVIADLREAASLKKKSNEAFFRVRGRILDSGGEPVRDAYVMASRRDRISGIPDFLTAGTGEDGCFTIYLPRGAFYLGAARAFPPGAADVLSNSIAVKGDVDDLELRVRSGGTTGTHYGQDNEF